MTVNNALLAHPYVQPASVKQLPNVKVVYTDIIIPKTPPPALPFAQSGTLKMTLPINVINVYYVHPA